MNAESALERLRELCRIPSISADLPEVGRAAEWLIERYGAAADRIGTFTAADGTPIGLLLEFDGEDAPGVTFYNYFDVTPADDGGWASPPFDPEVRDGRLYARGAAGNKGDLVARLEAVAAARTGPGLRRRVVFWLDGQEELGALTIPEMLDEWQRQLATPLVVWNTGFVNDAGAPIVSLGFKGIVVGTACARRERFASHSGVGLGTSGVRTLLEALMPLSDADEHRRLESFRVLDDHPFPEDPADLERAAETRLFDPLVDAALSGAFGEELRGAGAADIVRRALFEPTVNIPWIDGGSPDEVTRYAESARCALDVRIVPPQDAARLIEDLERHFGARDIEFSVRFALQPYVVEPGRRDEVLARLEGPLAAAFGTPPLMLPIAPSGAPAAEVAARLGSPVVGMGLTDGHARPHGTNESISCATFAQSLDAVHRLVAR
ncbi:MAG TPA: M20/M25/M40 family metallo-hydrolase [Gaiellaceae bacterium]|jgi:acetylornithine deacetylase/succinyl-diaminopimelate desuccinylase-like protein